MDIHRLNLPLTAGFPKVKTAEKGTKYMKNHLLVEMAGFFEASPAVCFP